jgi:hypothetical protein
MPLILIGNQTQNALLDVLLQGSARRTIRQSCHQLKVVLQLLSLTATSASVG